MGPDEGIKMAHGAILSKKRIRKGFLTRGVCGLYEELLLMGDAVGSPAGWFDSLRRKFWRLGKRDDQWWDKRGVSHERQSKFSTI